ncbi:MAG: FCD domain-containing protein [Magnetospirillum sp.]|nr:FCD domain-containing protein [Magnetospirillum sp.]
MREVTEALAARLAAGRMDEDAFARMATNLERQSVALAQDDQAAYSALDAEFHTLICDHCGNRPLQEVLRSIRDKIWPLKVPLGPLLPQLYQDHRALLEALRAEQPEQAEAIVRKHMQAIMEAIGQTMKEAPC